MFISGSVPQSGSLHSSQKDGAGTGGCGSLLSVAVPSKSHVNYWQNQHYIADTEQQHPENELGCQCLNSAFAFLYHLEMNGKSRPLLFYSHFHFKLFFCKMLLVGFDLDS